MGDTSSCRAHILGMAKEPRTQNPDFNVKHGLPLLTSMPDDMTRVDTSFTHKTYLRVGKHIKMNDFDIN